MTGMIGETVWVLHIHHKHGDDYQVYASKKGADEGLAEWCREWWDDAGYDKPAPEKVADLIDQYFESEMVSSAEWADINNLTVGE